MSSGIFEQTAPIGQTAGGLLMERGQTVAVIDGATGGLISASLISLPGATRFFKGSGVIYTLESRDLLLGMSPEELRGMRSATESYALVQARGVRKQFGADWGVAESGSAGPGNHPMGVPNGISAIAVVAPDGREWSRIVETRSDNRMDNMGAFARAALELLVEALNG